MRRHCAKVSKILQNGYTLVDTGLTYTESVSLIFCIQVQSWDLEKKLGSDEEVKCENEKKESQLKALLLDKTRPISKASKHLWKTMSQFDRNVRPFSNLIEKLLDSAVYYIVWYNRNVVFQDSYYK